MLQLLFTFHKCSDPSDAAGTSRWLPINAANGSQLSLEERSLTPSSSFFTSSGHTRLQKAAPQTPRTRMRLLSVHKRYEYLRCNHTVRREAACWVITRDGACNCEPTRLTCSSEGTKCSVLPTQEQRSTADYMKAIRWMSTCNALRSGV